MSPTVQHRTAIAQAGWGTHALDIGAMLDFSTLAVSPRSVNAKETMRNARRHDLAVMRCGLFLRSRGAAQEGSPEPALLRGDAAARPAAPGLFLW